ncbi:MAG TPA: MFS transporter [Streptosporangiaceae bacterium]
MVDLSQPSLGTRSARRGSPATPPQVLLIVCAGVVLASLDLFIVNVALPSIARDFHGSGLGELSWVLNGYAIVYASLLVLFGRFADRYPREIGFLVGVAVFTVASAACAAATSVAMLVAFRLVQAVGAALLTPTSLGLVLASYPAERRSGAVRAWAATGGLAAALGPVVGGLLVTASWRWVFLVNVPIGVAAIVVGWRKLPSIPGHAGPRPDALGALLITLAVGGISFGLVQGNSWGWGSAATVAVLAASVVVLGLFVAHCVRHHNPLIDPALFKTGPFSGASAVALLFSVAFGAMLLSIVLWAQDDWGWSALRTGLAIAPGPLMVPLFSFLVAGRAITRFGVAVTLSAGSVIFAAGLVWWSLAVSLHPDYPGAMLGGMLLGGIGVGLTMPTFIASAAAALPPHAFATGSGVVNMIRQIGLAVGVALLVAVLGAPGTAAGRLHAFQHAWLVAAGLSVAGVIPAVMLLRRRRLGETPAAR